MERARKTKSGRLSVSSKRLVEQLGAAGGDLL